MVAAVVGEAGDVRCVGGHVVQFSWGGEFWDGGAGEGSFAFRCWAGSALCDANRVADRITAEGGLRWWGGGLFLRCWREGGEVL